MLQLARELALLRAQRQVYIRCVHVPARENTEADVLSRLSAVPPVALTADLTALRSLQPAGVESLLIVLVSRLVGVRVWCRVQNFKGVF
eukprot:4608971-Amphidinium_carterae.1